MLMLCAAIIEEKPDRQRLERIYYGYRRQMLLTAQRVLHNRQDAEDAVQNALLGIARNIQTVPQDEKVERAYVLTAAKNSALKLLRGQRRRAEMLDIADVHIPSGDDLFLQAMNSLDYDLLMRALRQLDPVYRDVLLLVYVQEQSLDAAADILQRKKETVRKQLQRGKRLLAELCDKEGLCYGRE